METLGCCPDLPEGFHPSDSLLRFAAVLIHLTCLYRLAIKAKGKIKERNAVPLAFPYAVAKRQLMIS